MSLHLKRIAWKAGLLTMALILLGVTVAMAASGGLDTTFNSDGKLTTDFFDDWNDQLQGIALQPDGKIVAVGFRVDPAHISATTRDFAIARYQTDGDLDTTFSGDGKRLTDFGALEEAYAVAIQLDGKIVVSGQKCNTKFTLCDMAVARYKPTGALDTTFSADGKQVVDFGGRDNGSTGGLAIQPDGKIVIAGYMRNAAGDYDFAVYRLNPGGSLDTTFSGDGKQKISFGSGRQDEAEDLVLQGSSIVVAGESCDANWENCNFALARLTSTGDLDPTFSGDGKLTTNFGADEYVHALALQLDGKVVAVGERLSSSAQTMAVARYATDGSLDATFSGDGKLTLGMGERSWAQAVLVQANGKILVAGSTCDSTYHTCDFALARFNTGGTLNASFSGDGKVKINLAERDNAMALALQTDGKYVVGGSAYDGTQSDFALARVLP